VRSDNDITDVLENTFSTEDDRFGETVTIDLKAGGQEIAVTNENKREYVQCVSLRLFLRRLAADGLLPLDRLITEWRIQKRVEDQFKAFLSGFNELIPQELINVFDERELEVRRLLFVAVLSLGAYAVASQLLIGGMSEIDVEDWMKHTDYRGYQVRPFLFGSRLHTNRLSLVRPQQSDEVVKWFWAAVKAWPAEKKSRLLQFTTGTSRIPVNGFKDLQGSDGPRRFTLEKCVFSLLARVRLYAGADRSFLLLQVGRGDATTQEPYLLQQARSTGVPKLRDVRFLRSLASFLYLFRARIVAHSHFSVTSQSRIEARVRRRKHFGFRTGVGVRVEVVRVSPSRCSAPSFYGPFPFLSSVPFFQLFAQSMAVQTFPFCSVVAPPATGAWAERSVVMGGFRGTSTIW
jgi:hypothetical protein